MWKIPFSKLKILYWPPKIPNCPPFSVQLVIAHPSVEIAHWWAILPKMRNPALLVDSVTCIKVSQIKEGVFFFCFRVVQIGP